jgi:WD40 repeat protein/transcriptional regulator with XRE-family HTH domain
VPGDERSSQSFSDLLLRVRGRLGLTQRELAERFGVHSHSIHGWEAGTNYPGSASLQGLIAAVLRAGGFTRGREEEEAAELWAAAVRDSPRLRVPFDRAWFRTLAGPAGPAARSPAEVSVRPVDSGQARRRTLDGIRRQSWGDAPDVAGFVGREAERILLRTWVSDERCRVIGVLGLGGIGKTLLGARLAHDVASTFELVYWRSLRDAPTPSEWLAGAIGFLAPAEAGRSGDDVDQMRRLLALLSEARCLLVLDNFEAVLQPGDGGPEYLPGYEGYGALVRHVAEVPHRGCLVLTSREEPSELRRLRGQSGPVRMLTLTGLGVDDGQALLENKRLDGDDAAWQALVERYSGNSLGLKLVGETIRELFGGDIAEYLDYASSTSGVMIRGVHQLLEAQIRRLSAPELTVLRWIAVQREPIELARLANELRGHVDRGALLQAVEGLRRRSLLERGEQGPVFGLGSVVLEFVTEQLIDDALEELRNAAPPQVLFSTPLVTATARDYVRQSQERVIAMPLLDRLVASQGGIEAAASQLVALLDLLRQVPPAVQGYGPGNAINLLRLVRGDLRGVDLSGLAIRQAYLQDVEAQDATLAGADLAETALAQAFHYPTHVALSADATRLAVGTSTGDVHVWRVADQVLVASLRGHRGLILGVALTGDGRLVASSSYDGTVKLWASQSGRLLQSLSGHSRGTLGLAMSEDGRLVASGGFDGAIRVWDADSGRPPAILRGHTGAVWGMAVSADGRLLASGSEDQTVKVWEVETGRLLAALEGHTGSILGVALSGDGQVAASGGEDQTVRLWDTGSGRALATLHGHTGAVWGVALSGDGQLVAGSSEDKTIRLWEVASGRALGTLSGHTGGARGVALSADGHLLASGSVDGTVRLWTTGDGRLLTTFQGHTGGVRGVALSGDGQLAVSGNVDGTVRLWATGSGHLLAALQGHDGAVWGVALSADGRLAASGGHDETVRLWETERGRLLMTLQGRAGGVRGVALSGDGRLVAGGSVDGTVNLWEAESGRPLATLQGHTAEVHGVALSGDGRLMAGGSVDGTIKLWEVESGRLLATLEGHTGAAWGVSLTVDGRLVASSQDRAVRLWDTVSGRLSATLEGHTGAVWGVALTVDGRLLASGSEDRTVKLWEVETGRLLASLEGHTGGILSVAVSRDGDLVVSGSVDGTVRLWDARSGVCLRTLRDERRYERMDITGLTGITEAQRGALLDLGALDHRHQSL